MQTGVLTSLGRPTMVEQGVLEERLGLWDAPAFMKARLRERSVRMVDLRKRARQNHRTGMHRYLINSLTSGRWREGVGLGASL